MIDLEGSIRADGERLPNAWVGGLGERPMLVGVRGGVSASVDIELIDVPERFLIGRVAVGLAPTPAVAWSDRRLRETGGNIRVAELAAELGCSRRYLTSRFSAEVGLGPKAVARQVRCAGVRERLERTPQRLAGIVAAAGYCDQAHLRAGLPRADRGYADRVRRAADSGRWRGRRRLVSCGSIFRRASPMRLACTSCRPRTSFPPCATARPTRCRPG
jgi:AraC-like DNA-binding protein